MADQLLGTKRGQEALAVEVTKRQKQLNAARELQRPDLLTPAQPAQPVENPYDVPQRPCEGRRTLEWQQIEVYMEQQHLYEPVEDAAADYRLESLTPTTASITPSGSRPSSATSHGTFPFRTSAATVNLAGGHEDMNIFVKEFKSGDPSTTYFYLILVTLTPPHY